MDPGVKAGTEECLEKMRALSERALSAGGLHVAQGTQLWNLYRCALRCCGWLEGRRPPHANPENLIQEYHVKLLQMATCFGGNNDYTILFSTQEPFG